MVFGVTIEKTSSLNVNFNNRYWVNTATLGDAVRAGIDIATLEMDIFGNSVNFKNVHAWIPGSNPNQFANVAITGDGLQPSGPPMASFIVAKMIINTGAATYPNYKSYRVQVDPSFIYGHKWTNLYQLTLNAFASDIANGGYQISDRNGNLITSAQVDTIYHCNQEGKAWYNRTP
jgi:hypothetical protein